MDDRKRAAQDVFASLRYSSDSFPKAYPDISWSLTRPEADSNMAPVFLAHAKLYAFAEQRIVPRLKMLALHKIHTLLGAHTPNGGNLLAVLDLTTFAFDKDNTPEEVEGIREPLRHMVVLYVVKEIDVIGHSGLFTDYLEGGGPFVKLFWSTLQKALLTR